MAVRKKTTELSILATTTALVAVFTTSVKIPTLHGYLNSGDVAIAFTAAIFGPYAAMVAGGVGAALSDVISGYASWAPVTLLVHGLEGLLMGLVLKKRGRRLCREILSVFAAAAVVSGGYYALSALFLTGHAAALAEIPGNIIQASLGSALGLVLSRRIIRAYPPVTALSIGGRKDA